MHELSEQSSLIEFDDSSSTEKRRVIGNANNFWLWTAEDGFDLTHPEAPTSEPVKPRLRLTTANSPITIAPQKTALVIVDMQNAWLSQPLRPRGPPHDAEHVLLMQGIPAARKAAIRVVWLNWGFSQRDLATMSPTTERIFAFNAHGQEQPQRGIGQDMGQVVMEDGMTVEAGKFLVRDQWNSQLHAPLEKARLEGLETSVPDVYFHKSRISGFCHSDPDLSNYLIVNGIKTLLFAGCNTDVCVISTLQDSALQGFDTVLLKDGCGTTNGEAARIATERNCLKAWGFLSSCKALAEAFMDGAD